MRRRAADNRRPFRRRFSRAIWIVIGTFVIAALLLFIFHHNHQNEDHVEQSLTVGSTRNEQKAHEHFNMTEEIKNPRSYARQLTEQMTLAKAYVVIAKEHNNLHLAWEISSKIRICQSLLSSAAMKNEPISPQQAEPIIKTLSSLIFKAQDSHFDIATTLITMKSHIQALEERANAAYVQSAAFGQLASESLSKNLHCLNIKLMSDWVNDQNPLLKLVEEMRNSPRLVDNNLYHFCIISDNVIAVSAVINSTISNTEHPKQLVFHVVTNRINFGVMQAWFNKNNFQGSTIEIQSIDDFSWFNTSHLHEEDSGKKFFNNARLNHLRFYIPNMYPQLEKIVFLEDDIITQKDLTPLFSLDLHGNVNGAVETCLEAFQRYYMYLNFSNPIISSKFDPQSCGWAFGLNVFDLISWRRENVTSKYHYWLDQNRDGNVWKLGILPPGLLSFYGLTEPLDRRWHVLGLGYDPNIDNRLIESAAVVHFNGNMKPWLRLGISKYRPLWEMYVNQSHSYIQDCVTI